MSILTPLCEAIWWTINAEKFGLRSPARVMLIPPGMRTVRIPVYSALAFTSAIEPTVPENEEVRIQTFRLLDFAKTYHFGYGPRTNTLVIEATP